MPLQGGDVRVHLLAAAVLGMAMTQGGGQEFRLGGPVLDFTVRDMKDQASTFSTGKGQVIVVLFFSTRCPMSNAFNYRRNLLYNDFKDRVKFIAVDTNANESLEEVRRYASEVGFDFPVYKDVNNEIADRFGVKATTENFVIDASGFMRYHGYVEDAVNPSRTARQGLRQAIGEVLHGKPVTLAETGSRGCAIRQTRP